MTENDSQRKLSRKYSLYSQLSILIEHVCLSNGKLSKFMGQESVNAILKYESQR